MVPRPFPLPLRTGIDICRFGRIGRLLLGEKNDPELPGLQPLLRRVLNDAERAIFRVTDEKHFQRIQKNKSRVGILAEYLAGR
jgi:hypothetical protein